MAEKTLNETIIDLITDTIQNQRPLPTIVTVTATHNNGYIDITDPENNVIKNIECIGTPTINKKALLIRTETGQIVIT